VTHNVRWRDEFSDMSTPTFFFAGTTFDVATMNFPQDLEVKSVVRSKNITPGMIGDLDFLLTGSRDREPDCVRDDDDVAVFQLDKELVEALGVIDETALDDVADEWGISDTASTLDLLNQLNALAQKALSHNEAVFLYF
jgi:hypothetical protein